MVSAGSQRKKKAGMETGVRGCFSIRGGGKGAKEKKSTAILEP